MINSIIISVFASSGFWALITAIFTTRAARKAEEKRTDDSERQLLIGLAHDRIYGLCSEYIQRGEITLEEYDNLTYLYKPYEKAGGNGTGKRLFEQVEKLPIRH